LEFRRVLFRSRRWALVPVVPGWYWSSRLSSLTVYSLPSTSTPASLISSMAICRPFWTFLPYSAAPPLIPAEYPMTIVPSSSEPPPPPEDPQAASVATRPAPVRTATERMVRFDSAAAIWLLLIENDESGFRFNFNRG